MRAAVPRAGHIMLKAPPPPLKPTSVNDDFSAWMLSRPFTAPPAPPRAASRGRTNLVFAAGLFVAALLVRWPLIQRGETLVHSDEAIVGIMAQDIAQGRAFPIFFFGQRYMGALEAYVIAALGAFVDDPIISLRLGPAMFFAAFVAVQFLMLTSWFGRLGGLMGAAVLLAGSPMFAQWSISARGGYIELLLWASLLMWAYTSWIVPTFHHDGSEAPRGRSRRLVLVGGLIGSGMWVNPGIALFVLPLAIHFVIGLRRPDRRMPPSQPLLPRLSHRFGTAALPLLALAVVLAMNGVWSVRAVNGRVESALLLNLLPRNVAAGLLVLAIATAGVFVFKKTDALRRVRAIVPLAAPAILGVVIGCVPVICYVAQVATGWRAMEPSLPLGLRPIWTIGEPLQYLLAGLPILLGADPQPFLDLVTIGRPSVFAPPGFEAQMAISAAHYLACGALLSALIAYGSFHRRSWTALLRLEPRSYSPAVLLGLVAAAMFAMYLLSGATHDFNTIRYLVPLWAIVPGLLAAVACRRGASRFIRSLGLMACAAWTIGQIGMAAELGRPHPLRPVADALEQRAISTATAEIFDAHLLSFLTGQRCRVAEYAPFWSRLSQYKDPRDPDPFDYIVLKDVRPVAQQRQRWNFPGPPPPETLRIMPRRIEKAIADDPSILIKRTPLDRDYDLVRLRRRIPE